MPSDAPSKLSSRVCALSVPFNYNRFILHRSIGCLPDCPFRPCLNTSAFLMHSSCYLFCSKCAQVLSLGLNRPLFLFIAIRAVSHMLWRLMLGLCRHDEGDTGYINASHLRNKDFEQPKWEYIAAQARPWRLLPLSTQILHA